MSLERFLAKVGVCGLYGLCVGNLTLISSAGYSHVLLHQPTDVSGLANSNPHGTDACGADVWPAGGHRPPRIRPARRDQEQQCTGEALNIQLVL